MAMAMALPTTVPSATAQTRATAQSPALPSATPIPPCYATTTAAVNLRDVPDGNRLGGVYQGVYLVVVDQLTSWYKVDYFGTIGWISADHAVLSGAC